MGFACPKCSKNSLAISAAIELPADSRSDEISLQVVACDDCGFKGLAVNEESRRGALDAESWEHIGYQINSLDLKSIVALINKCPQPRDVHCQCLAHRALGQRNENGRWNGLNYFDVTATFPMKMMQ